MVSARCKMVVRDALKAMGLHFVIVDLGEVDVMENITTTQREQLRTTLQDAGLELMEDKRAILLEKIKLAIIDIVHHREEDMKINFSHYLSEKLDYDYTHLANIFSEASGTTIEQYMIAQKIERIKELITYDELNITEIAWKMNYSSVAHLSNQFKKVTGLTPSHFRKIKENKRQTLEEV
jgi:YesN/AraC family two-component response regulator